MAPATCDEAVSLAGSNDGTLSTDASSDNGARPVAAADSGPKSLHRDSFAALTGLMKAKKPYSLPSTPVVRSSFSTAPSTGMPNAKREVQADRTPVSSSEQRNKLAIHTKVFREQSPPHTSSLSPSPSLSLSTNSHSELQRQPALTEQGGNFSVDYSRTHTHTPTGDVHTREQATAQKTVLSPSSIASELSKMKSEVNELEKEKILLEGKLAVAESLVQRQVDTNDAQLGRLRYQQEVDRDQKAGMSRILSEKELELRKQQLQVDDLSSRLNSLQHDLAKSQKANGEAVWMQDTLKTTVHKLEEEIRELRITRNAADHIQNSSVDQAASIQSLTDALAERERVIRDIKHEHLAEQMKWVDLEDEVESLREQVNQENIDQIRNDMREFQSQRDRYRVHLQQAEQQLKLSQSRLHSALNGGEIVRGAVHLVTPNPESKLPKGIMSCIECYRNNFDCDNNSRCRNCEENNERCARWRCSLKHKLGECNNFPCTFPHDNQGWLVLKHPRPEW